ncbi:substrate-binding domain-containing protein [Enterococcus faecium]|nr:substrate-binding domain-containing protein [Enterococcus lactis]EMF0367381.1 substrate-binding domain-containing protein [Enterococcus faecium]
MKLSTQEKQLKNVSLKIPKNKISIFTSVSGSGKSSIVFDTITQEAGRQLNDTYDSFTRLFLPKYSRPEVDEIDNLSTAIVVNQKKIGGSARSTLGTITNINALFRVLFSCFATPSLGYANAYSFNDPSGMCSVCQGIGKTIAFLIGLLYFSAIDNADFVFSDPFTAEVLSGIEEQAKNHGYFVLVHNVNSAEDVKTIQRNWRFEGFIVVGVRVKEFLELNNVFDGPVVYIDTHLSKETLRELEQQMNRLFVNTNDYQASTLAVEHLIYYGHEKIAFLSFDYIVGEPSVIQERHQAYIDTLKKYHLTFKSHWIYNNSEFERIYQELAEFTAIVVTGDYLAAKLVKFLKNKNKRVMEQLSIIGFDDITFAELMDPALTTIRLNPGNKGAIAFHQLIGLAKQEEIKNQVLLLEGELISRDSVHKIK